MIEKLISTIADILPTVLLITFSITVMKAILKGFIESVEIESVEIKSDTQHTKEQKTIKERYHEYISKKKI